MPGRTRLSRIQIGRETTPGTMVAATARLRVPAAYLRDERKHEFIEEAVGIFQTDRGVISAVNAAISIPDTALTPEQLPYFLAAALGGPTSGAADGTGSSGFRYVTTIPTTSAPTNTAYTIETGDDYEVERAGYGKCTKITLKGAGDGLAQMSSEWIAQRVERLSGGFSTTSIPDVDHLPFALARLWLDPVSGAFGTTAVNNQFKGFELTIEAMWEKQFTADAPTASGPIWTFAVFANYRITGKLTFLHDPATSGSGGLKEHFRAAARRLMRIELYGRPYATAGSGTLLGARRGLRIDLPIAITKAPELDNENQVSIVNVEFESRFNATANTAGTITVCNETNTLP